MKFIFFCVFPSLFAAIDTAIFGDVARKFLNYLPSAFNAERVENNEHLDNIIKPKAYDRHEDYGVQQKEYVRRTDEKNTLNPDTEYKNEVFVKQGVPGVQNQKTNKVIEKRFYYTDPHLNSLRRRSNALNNLDIKKSRRVNLGKPVDYMEYSETSKDSSSSREMKSWKKEFRQWWQHKKFQALNNTPVGGAGGDKVNMIAARPWGVPCGDPNQHDMPWGSCMLAAECEPEFRIYRGDYFCGRTQFICCGIQLTNYDNYEGFDVSFDDKSLSSDSKDRNAAWDSKERKKKMKKKKRKRRQEREKRKQRMKKHIKKIIHEIRKILTKQYKNGTAERKKRTQQLKKFIKYLKKQYKKDRMAVKDIHDNDLIRIDSSFLAKLYQMKEFNKKFADNATFREIIKTGMMTMNTARMLVEAYPDLGDFIASKNKVKRRVGGGPLLQTPELDYDVEYGYLYY